jgi:two-component system nitrogen regulation response regulator GlnG
MLKATASCETGFAALDYFRPTTSNRNEMTGCRDGGRALSTRPASPLLKKRSASEFESHEAAHERTDRGTASRILVIADEPALLLEHLQRAFPAPSSRIQVANLGPAAFELIRTESPEVIILDLDQSDQSGLEIHRQIRNLNARTPVIAVAKAGRADAAIEPMKQGAYDCLFKPLETCQLQRVLGAALEIARRSHPTAVAEKMEIEQDTEEAFVGSCSAMGEVFKAIGRVAAQDVPVLITGESGTGKELVARALYRHGPRAQAPFLALNCAAIPENLLESELFGHEKGAFTGAEKRRIGKFEQCDGGTIFLDEIGDMPLALQAKILRVVQEQAFERVGGNETIRTNVRLIAATHRNLRAWSAEGKFRSDLYYRLGVFSIHLPPLRERGDDLAQLVKHYIRRFSTELGREVREVSPEAMERLRDYKWPGNIRELQSVLKQALLQASGPVLLAAFLPPSLERQSDPASAAHATAEPGVEKFVLRQRLGAEVRDLYAEAHSQIDRLMLPRVMECTRGNLQQAALILGIARQTLRMKLRELGLPARRLIGAEEFERV